MNIPESIVERIASETFGPDWGVAHPEDQGIHRDEVRKVLQEAAPFIAAQALHDEADRVYAMEKSTGPDRVRVHEWTLRLHLRADELDPS